MDTISKNALPHETNVTFDGSAINENVSDWANQYLKSGSSFAVSFIHLIRCLFRSLFERLTFDLFSPSKINLIIRAFGARIKKMN